MKSICVFSGSRSGSDPTYAATARSLALHLATHNQRLIYGGGSVGLMGEMADIMLKHGGEVIGVIPKALARVELMHDGVADMRVVADMHERKAMMHELADAYIALPGGFGTMEELFEALCWSQLDFHSAPVAILNANGFYDGLVDLLDGMVRSQFLSEDHRSILFTAESVEELCDWLSRLSASHARVNNSGSD